jgi:hypothetical protein
MEPIGIHFTSIYKPIQWEFKSNGKGIHKEETTTSMNSMKQRKATKPYRHL